MKKIRETNQSGYVSLSTWGLSAYRINLKKGLVINGQKILGSPDGKNGHIKALLMNDNGERENYQIYKLIWCVGHDEKEIPVGYKLIHLNDDRTDNRLINIQLVKTKNKTSRGDDMQKYICLKDINTHEILKFILIDDAIDFTGLYKKHFYKSAILQEPLKAKNGNIYTLYIEIILK